MKTWMALLALAGLTACQSVTSRHVDFASGQIADGLQYAVPKALVTVELVASGVEMQLNVSQPFLVGDPNATFALSASSGLFADQTYLFVVNPRTRLLTYINSRSEGKAGVILNNLAQSVGAIGGATRTPGAEAGNIGGAIVFSTVIDPFEYEGCDFAKPCTLTKLGREIRDSALGFMRCNLPEWRDHNRGSCLLLEANPDYFRITMQPLFTLSTSNRPAGPGASPDACHSSICYRAPAPYLMGVQIGGQSNDSRIVLMPNESPIMSMSLPAGVFATAHARVELVQGMPSTILIDRKSELVGVTSIPLSMIRSFFSAVGEVFQLRINYDTRTVDLLRNEQLRQKAEDDYRDAQEARRKASDARRAARDAVDAATASGDATTIAGANAALADATADEAEAVDSEAAAEETLLGVQPPTDSDGGSPESASLAADPRLLSPEEDTSTTSIAAAQEAAITIMEKPKAMIGLKALQFAPLDAFTPGANADATKAPADDGGEEDAPAGEPGQ
jgi:hypothetical protein